jgi:hypothetical protein
MINNSRGGHRVAGSLRASDGIGVVRMEDRYDTDMDDLWSALTDPTRLFVTWRRGRNRHRRPALR